MNNNPEQIKNEIIQECKSTYQMAPFVEDIGDILPFLYYFGEKEFCYQQIRETLNIIKDKYLCERSKYVIGISDNIDMILGFIELYRLSKDDYFLINAENIFKAICEHFVYGGRVYGHYYKYLHIAPPKISLYGAVILEFAVDLYELTNDDEYLYLAEKLALKLINDTYFKKYGIFYGTYWPIRSLLFFRKKRQFLKLTKGHNFIFGMISLYKQINNIEIKRSLEKYFATIKKYLFKNQLLYSEMNLKTYSLSRPNLFPTFLTIDRLCYAAYIFNEQCYLDFAKEIALPWIEKQSSTGLFPFYYQDEVSWLDSETDMSISLLSIYELSKEDIFKKSADKCYEGILKYNYPYESVNIHSGKPLKNLFLGSTHSSHEYFADTKYKALILKLLILYNSSTKIFEDDGLFKLIRDR